MVLSILDTNKYANKKNLLWICYTYRFFHIDLLTQNTGENFLSKLQKKWYHEMNHTHLICTQFLIHFRKQKILILIIKYFFFVLYNNFYIIFFFNFVFFLYYYFCFISFSYLGWSHKTWWYISFLKSIVCSYKSMSVLLSPSSIHTQGAIQLISDPRKMSFVSSLSPFKCNFSIFKRIQKNKKREREFFYFISKAFLLLFLLLRYFFFKTKSFPSRRLNKRHVLASSALIK